ncbi:ribbon-helix-helix protein, CopG family [bacterium]|nr:ribbon-helix-helix protein, CopG family [bacterium]
MAITSIRLQADLEPNLDKLAKKFHRSKKWVINQAIRDYIEKQQIESKRWEDTLLALESVVFGCTPEGLLKLQLQYNLWRAENRVDLGSLKKIEAAQIAG